MFKRSPLKETLIDPHWRYVMETLLKHGVSDRDIQIAEYHYKTGMAHGYKHGVADAKNEPTEDTAA